MVEYSTFPNVEAQMLAYLDPLLASYDPPTESHRVLPSPLPDGPFVRVMLTGSRRLNLAQMDRQVTFEAWGETGANADTEAEQLGMHLYGLVGALALPDGTHVPDGEDGWVGGPYPDVDPTSGRPRYIMTAIVRQAAIVTST